MISILPSNGIRNFERAISRIDNDRKILMGCWCRCLSTSSAGSSKNNRQKKTHSTYKFVDRVRMRVTGGAGGKGCTSYYRYINGNRRPNGGNGGHGGAVILLADPREQTSLRLSKHHITAQNGANGSSNGRHGRNGRNTIVHVPCGVVVRRVLEYHQMWDESLGQVVQKPGYEQIFDTPDDESWEDLGDESIEEEHEKELELYQNYSDAYHWEEESESNETISNSNEDHDDLKGDRDDEEEEEAAASTGLWTFHHEKMHDARFETTASATKDHMEKENLTACVGHSNESKIEEEGTVKVDNEERQQREHVFLCDLDKPGSYVVVARGGQGGIGNEIDAQRHYSPQRFQQSFVRAQSTPGESVFLELELKLIADVGLVGFPNAGKSSLLAAMSRAQPKIAPYPFTTLHPLVGIIEYKDGLRVATADIPGLIEGAHVGRGRGYEFLRHLERTKALLYIVDAAGVDGRDPLDDIRILAEELASYGNGELLYDRNALIVANKVDLIPTVEERDELLVEIGLAAELSGIKIFDSNDNQTRVLGISAGVTGEGLPLLSKKIRSIVLHTEAERHASSSSPDQTNNNRILFESESY